MKQRTKGKAKSPSIMKTKESEKCIHAKNQLKIADFIDRHYLIPIKSEKKYIGKFVDTYIGDFCVIGIGAIIMAGVKIGNEVVVGAGSVVTKDIPSNVIVAGNPAKIIKENIKMENILL